MVENIVYGIDFERTVEASKGFRKQIMPRMKRELEKFIIILYVHVYKSSLSLLP